MNYHIASESRHRIRIRMCVPRLTREQADILRYAFSGMAGVENVTVYRETGGCALEYSCPREEVIRRLDQFRFENVKMLADEEVRHISAAEMKDRKLDPSLKRHLRMRILAETAADALLPLPVQLMYHAYQMITLKDL